MQFILLLSLLVFSFFRFRTLMLFFQQDEYDNVRFLKNVYQNKNLIDKKLSITLLVLLLISLTSSFLSILLIPVLIFFVIREERMQKKAKKKLVMTIRVRRIISVSLAWTAGCIALFSLMNIFLEGIVIVQLLPILLVLGNLTLVPVEKRIQDRIIKEAKANLKKCDPIVIGITGSYGKTSTKHILAHILSSANKSVLFTPGSVNTPMGICRILREKLKPEHRYFIAEMGAYHKGSIDILCRLVNPKYGIVTSIGQAHYERFGSQKNVAEAKFEITDYVQKNDGFLIANADQIKAEFIPHNKKIIQCGKNKDYFVSDMAQSRDGISFYFHHKDKKTLIKAPVFGLHHVNNIATSITFALELGIPMSTVQAALKSLPQINHRLEVKTENGITFIDDAYNSNVEGFKSALNLLKTLKTTRGILVTPGMVELGKLNDVQHAIVGELAAKTADIVILIIPERLTAFIEAFKKEAPKSAQLITFNTFAQARQWMNRNLQIGDVVLLENDLPDLYESKFSL